MDLLYALGVLASTIAFVVQACVWMWRQRRRRLARDLVISPRSGLAMGALFLGLQAILNPDTEYVIAEQIKERADEDESGAEPLGGRFFHQQLRRIRRGMDVQQLVVQIAPAPDAAAQPGSLTSSAAVTDSRACNDTT